MAKITRNSLPDRLPIAVIPNGQTSAVFHVSVSAETTDGEEITASVKIVSSFTTVPGHEEARSYLFDKVRPALKAWLEAKNDDELFDIEADGGEIEI